MLQGRDAVDAADAVDDVDDVDDADAADVGATAARVQNEKSTAFDAASRPASPGRAPVVAGPAMEPTASRQRPGDGADSGGRSHWQDLVGSGDK